MLCESKGQRSQTLPFLWTSDSEDQHVSKCITGCSCNRHVGIKCAPGCLCKKHSRNNVGKFRPFVCVRCGKDKHGPYYGAPKTVCQECLDALVMCMCGCGQTFPSTINNRKFYSGYCVARFYDSGKFLPRFYGDDNYAKLPEVREKLRLGKLGDKNPNWNKDWSWDQYAPYQRVFYQCKIRVWKRDKGTCQACGLVYNPVLKKRTHVVHHVDEDPSHNVDENLVLLCRRCHRLVHSGAIEGTEVLHAV